MARGVTRERDGHSSRTPVARRVKQPTRMTGPDGPDAKIRRLARQRHSYSVLLPVGFAVPPPSLEARCALTAPFHPCLGQNATQPRRSLLCGTVPETPPRGRSAGCYPAPFVHGARTFLPTPPFGIGAERPSGRLTGKGMGAGAGGVKPSASRRAAAAGSRPAPAASAASMDRRCRRHARA